MSLIAPALAEYWGDDDPEPTYTPDMPEFHWNEGNSYYLKRDYDLAIESYQKATEIDPSFSNAYHGLAFTYRALGRLDLALDNYGEVIRLTPDYAQPYMRRAELYQFIGRMEEAEQDLDTFVKLYGQYPAPYLARGDFFMERGEYARAAADYATAIERKPDLLTAYTKNAEALLLSGRPGEASDAFARAMALAGEVAPADAREIDTIVLTLSPSFGVEGEMTDTVKSLVPDAESIALLHEHGFFDMPEYLETGVLDGHFTWITVHFNNGESKRVGGLVAEEFGSEDFVAIYDAVVSALDGQ